MTGFAKRGLPHTSNLPTLVTHNFRLEKAIDLKCGLSASEHHQCLLDGEISNFLCFLNSSYGFPSL